MDALLTYGSDSDSDGDAPLSNFEGATFQTSEEVENCDNGSHAIQHCSTLPPPPEELLTSSALPGSEAWNESLHGGRIRTFAHVEGNYALHIYIPVTLPSYTRKEVAPFIDKALKGFPGLRLLEEGFAPTSIGGYGRTEVQSGSAVRVKLGGEYHISLSRTVPIRIHQIESITSMLRHKFSSQKKFLAEFSSWEVFTNDEHTRTFLSLEITRAGLSEINKQVLLVDEVFRLHNLPTFYKNPRPHISLAWALGEVISLVRLVADELNKFNASTMSAGGRNPVLWSSQVTRVECKVGQRVYPVWSSNP